MTPGNNGPGSPAPGNPEDDDPFGYLYADGQANGAQPPSGGYGYPNSVSRVRAVGERQYAGQQRAGAPHGQVPPQQQPGPYGQPNTHYAAPETFPGGAPAGPPQQPPRAGGSGGSGRGGRGPNTKGLLIGAVAVVAAVVIGIGLAMANGDPGGDKSGDGAGATAPAQSQSSEPSPSSSSSAPQAVELPTMDAGTLQLAGGATPAADVEGAQSAGGAYVTGLNKPGASVTWTVDDIPEDGVYTLFARYSVAGEDQSMTLIVNGKPFGSKLNMSNFAGADKGDFAKGWTKTYAWPTLTKGTNTITLACQDGDKCNVLLDQLSLKQGQVKN
ncbi:carbohydrate-binding protein [Streptomyces sp. MS06]|uniref:carbohydrate-binding protein n=1 Tax=Streptomyces sp. MS06 TaxID=3385974 RepID=UPI0039A3B375